MLWAMSRLHLPFGLFYLMAYQSAFQAINQGFLAEGLAQEPDCPRCQYLHACRLIGKSWNKDCWRCETIDDETMIELHATQTRQMHIGDQTTFQSRDSKQENLRLTHKSLPHNPTIERSVQSPSARIHRGRQWKSLLALTVPEGRVAALFTWQLGADCRAERPGSCSVMGKPPALFFLSRSALRTRSNRENNNST